MAVISFNSPGYSHPSDDLDAIGITRSLFNPSVPEISAIGSKLPSFTPLTVTGDVQ
jgi:hypothetical protein